MNSRFVIRPISDSIFTHVDSRGYFSNEKVGDFQELYDCSWNFDRLILPSPIGGEREIVKLQENGSLNAFACVDTTKNYPIAFFTLAAASLDVPAEFRKGSDDVDWNAFPSIQIDYLFVDKELQRCGVGSFILNWIKENALKKCRCFEAFRFIFLNSIKTEQALSFYRKNLFLFADENDRWNIEESLNDGTFYDEKDVVVPMFFDLKRLN